MGIGFNNSMENLASHGVLDFDANAYVMGTKPQYVGSPEPSLEMPFDKPLPAAPNYYGGGFGLYPNLAGQPRADAFISRTSGHGISTGEGLIAGVLATLGLIGLSKLNFNKKPAVPLLVSPEKFDAAHKGEKIPVTPSVTKKKSKVKTNGTKTDKTTAKASTETTKASSSTVTETKKASTSVFSKVKNAFSTAWTKIKNTPKSVRYGVGIAAGITAGLAVLYGIAKSHSEAQIEQPKF